MGVSSVKNLSLKEYSEDKGELNFFVQGDREIAPIAVGNASPFIHFSNIKPNISRAISLKKEIINIDKNKEQKRIQFYLLFIMNPF